MCTAHGEILYVFVSRWSLRGRLLTRNCAAPVLRDVKIKYSDHLFNGSFMEEDVYRKAGSDEVDAAWEALGVDCKLTNVISTQSLALTASLDRAGVISEEEGRRSGLTDAHVQVSEKYGGGFIVNVEGMHHLHCLVGSLPLFDLSRLAKRDPDLGRIWFASPSTSTTTATRPSVTMPL